MDPQAITTLEIDWEYLRWNALLSTRRRLLYVATPKVACTSIKWWFARLEGYSAKLQAASEESKETAHELIIHDSFHRVAPLVAGLPPESLAEAIYSDDYFRFAVVRNPFKRILSAWQSKLLLREPLQVGPYLDKAFYHHPVRSTADVAHAFEMFLEHLVAEEAPAFWDVHWTPQVRLVRPDLIQYTILSQIENVSSLERSLGEWLGEDVPSPFANRGSNESLLPYQEEFISARSAELIRRLYSADFEQFGYGLDPPASKEKLSSREFDLALKAIDMVRSRHERIGVMRAALDRRLHDLQVESASKDEGLDALRHALADTINQHAQLQRQLAAQLEQTETDRFRLAAQLEQVESSHRMLVERNAELEVSLAGLESESAENERVRLALKDELNRAELALRKLGEEVDTYPSNRPAFTSERLGVVGRLSEMEGFPELLAPLQRLSAQMEEIRQISTRLHSARFLAKRLLVILGKRVIGHRT